MAATPVTAVTLSAESAATDTALIAAVTTEAPVAVELRAPVATVTSSVSTREQLTSAKLYGIIVLVVATAGVNLKAVPSPVLVAVKAVPRVVLVAFEDLYFAELKSIVRTPSESTDGVFYESVTRFHLISDL